MSKRIEVPDPTTGFGYVGQWLGGSLGWCLPNHLGGHSRKTRIEPVTERYRLGLLPKRFFLCRITVTPLLDKRGRPITAICRKDGER